MKFFATTAEARQENLGNRWLVVAVAVGALAIYLSGALRSPYPYGGANFVIGYFFTELLVFAYLAAATWLFFPAERLGLRRMQVVKWKYVLPFALWLAAAVAGWLVTRLSLPPGVVADDQTALLTLRTTLMVGATEEWLFRGLLLAAFCRWFGLRRGAFAALAAFGAFHLLNVAAGVPPLVALLQMLMTFTIGAILLLAAIGLRSLWVPVLGHGLYDFAVFDVHTLAAAGADALVGTLLPLAGLLIGVLCLVMIARMPGSEPYVDAGDTVVR